MKINQPLVSFAIPTYNFGPFIQATVDSILQGANQLRQDQIEIIILDGGSTDNTSAIASNLLKSNSNIKYIRNEIRGGIDKDLYTVASLATGQYIWLFSADDLLLPNWDTYVIAAIATQPDLILVPAILCDLRMKHLRPHPIFKGVYNESNVEFAIRNLNDIHRYLSKSNSLESLFGFMSAVVIRSSALQSATPRTDYFGTCWAHCAMLIPKLLSGSRLVYCTSPLIEKRGENDSFMEYGLTNRIRISIDGWTRIIKEFFPDDSNQKILMSLLRRDTSIELLLYAKVFAHNREQRILLDRLAKALYIENHPDRKTRIMHLVYQLFPKDRATAYIIGKTLPALNVIRKWHKARRA